MLDLRFALSAILVLVWAIGCDGSPLPAADGGPPDANEPLFVFFFAPADRTSNVGAEPSLTLLWGQLPPDALLEDVYGALHLTREPAREEVAFAITTVSATSTFPQSVITPDAPLEDGFYRLWVDSLPGTVTTLQTASPDSTFGVRFASHSAPHVIGVESCLHSDGPRSVVVSFSEPMDPATAEHVSFEGDACEAATFDSLGGRLEVTCEATEQEPISAVLDLSEVRAATGEALIDAPGAEGRYAFDPLDAEQATPFEGCLTTFAYWPTPY